MYQIINFVIKPFLFLLKNKKAQNKGWRNLSSEKMILSYKELKNVEKYSFKEVILTFLLNILYFILLSSFKKKKHIQKKVPGNYYPLN
tara:strand:- start:30786 stop:31049 length:264 start_codon:yes stop_codon:yes gene_type:complete